MLWKKHASLFLVFFFNDTATTEIYTLSLHDALPISARQFLRLRRCSGFLYRRRYFRPRSEEHTSELQSLAYLVCRLLREKKKNLVLPGTHHSAERCQHLKCPRARVVGVNSRPRSASIWPVSRGGKPFFFFRVAAPPELYTLSLHDALPI